MFGLGMSEMVLIGIVALIVIGPKDLPGMFRTMGQMTGKARAMAREFSRAMEAAADESGLKEMSNTFKAASNPKQFGTDALKRATGLSDVPRDPLAKTTQEAAARANVPASAPAPDTQEPAPDPIPAETTDSKPKDVS
jgi:sec-independent protein translocase protein TatB